MKQLTPAFSTVPSQTDISYLKNRLDFESILEQLGIQVSHTLGIWIMAHCPNGVVHKSGDINPSFGFNTEEMYGNCFVCGSKTLLKLVEEQLELSEQDAVSWLKEQSTFEPAKSEDFVEKINKILHPIEKIEIMPEFPDATVFKYRFIHPYLLERGISQEIIQEMNVGFDDDHLGIVIPHWWNGKLRGWQVRHLLEKDGKYYCPTCGQKDSPTVAKEPKAVAKYNNTCVSEDTEALTSSGWKNLDTITLDDLIASVDIFGNVKFLPIKALSHYDYDDKMIHIKNQNTDQLLTPNHKVWLYPGKQKRKKITQKRHKFIKDYKICPGCNISKSRDEYLPSLKKKLVAYCRSCWSNTYQLYPDVLIQWSADKLIHGEKGVSTYRLPLGAKTLEEGDFISTKMSRLYGWIIAEGYLHRDCRSISIYQSSINSDYVNEIRYLIEELSIPYSEYTKRRSYKNREYFLHQFYLHVSEITEQIYASLESKKPAPKWELLGLSYDHLVNLFEALVSGDGHWSKSDIYQVKSGTFFQKRTDVLDWFQALCSLINIRTTLSRGSAAWCYSNTTDFLSKSPKISLIDYQGRVWCPTTETGAWIARRNGKVFVTGNSGFPKKNTIYNLDNISEESVIVVESPMSVLKLKSLGLKNVVATFGSFSKEQAKELAKFSLVLYWPDNDPAGIINANHVINHLSSLTKVMIIPSVEKEKGDPADLNTFDEVIKYIDIAQTPATYKLKANTK